MSETGGKGIRDTAPVKDNCASSASSTIRPVMAAAIQIGADRKHGRERGITNQPDANLRIKTQQIDNPARLEQRFSIGQVVQHIDGMTTKPGSGNDGLCRSLRVDEFERRDDIAAGFRVAFQALHDIGWKHAGETSFFLDFVQGDRLAILKRNQHGCPPCQDGEEAKLFHLPVYVVAHPE